MFIAAREADYAVVKILVDREADVNIPSIENANIPELRQDNFLTNYLTLNIHQRQLLLNLCDNFSRDTPLHVAINYPDIVQLLIAKKADIEAEDFLENTPLFNAIRAGNLEIVYMLLSHNADVNHVNGCGDTPFLTAVIHNQEHIIEVLMDYTAEFNITNDTNVNTLEVAIQNGSPYSLTIARRYEQTDINMVDVCCRYGTPVNEELFKIIWDKLIPDEYVTLHHILTENFQTDTLNRLLNHIIESPNKQLMIDYFNANPTYHFRVFVKSFCKMNCDETILEKIVFVLLENSYELRADDIYEIFYHFGFCELIKLLRYVNYTGKIDTIMDGNPTKLLFNLIFNVQDDMNILKRKFRRYLSLIPEMYVSTRFKLNMAYYSQLCADRQALKICQWTLPVEYIPAVPDLQELARDSFKLVFAKKNYACSTSQYYTFIDNNIFSATLRHLLKYEKSLYYNYALDMEESSS